VDVGARVLVDPCSVADVSGAAGGGSPSCPGPQPDIPKLMANKVIAAELMVMAHRFLFICLHSMLGAPGNGAGRVLGRLDIAR
jgi:hypothetical protein